MFQVRQDSAFIEMKCNLIRKKLIEGIKASIFLETDLSIKVMLEHQSNLEKKDNPSILKGIFSLRVTFHFYTKTTKIK